MVFGTFKLRETFRQQLQQEHRVLILAYDFDDTLIVLGQHFLRSDKTTFLIHLAISLNVSSSLNEAIRIMTSVKKESIHTACLTSNYLIILFL